jgi:hypothetical protein
VLYRMFMGPIRFRIRFRIRFLLATRPERQEGCSNPLSSDPSREFVSTGNIVVHRSIHFVVRCGLVEKTTS